MKVICVPINLSAVKRLNYDINETNDLIEMDLDDKMLQRLFEIGFFEKINAISGALIDDFEDEMFEATVEPRDILALRKILSLSEFSIGHLPSVTKQMQNFYLFKDDLKWRMRDLHDHCERNKNWIDAQGDHITHAIDLYWGLESNRTNAQIKKLSLLASISIPMTFWASFWGMNFQAIPFESVHFFQLAIGVMLLSSLSVYLFLRKKGYW